MVNFYVSIYFGKCQSFFIPSSVTKRSKSFEGFDSLKLLNDTKRDGSSSPDTPCTSPSADYQGNDKQTNYLPLLNFSRRTCKKRRFAFLAHFKIPLLCEKFQLCFPNAQNSKRVVEIRLIAKSNLRISDLSEAATPRSLRCPQRLFVLLVGQKYIH